jgi:sec-independent protein translocase protein TatA
MVKSPRGVILGVVELGPPELLIVLALALLMFGSKKLPELARSLGSAKREFAKGVREGGDTPAPSPDPEEKITMTRAELDRLIAERESQSRNDPSSPT